MILIIMTTTTTLMMMMNRITVEFNCFLVTEKRLLRFIDYTAAEQAWDVNTTLTTHTTSKLITIKPKHKANSAS